MRRCGPTEPGPRACADPVEQANGDSIASAGTFPTDGKYRLFLQFRVAGRVQTVAFTQEALGGR